MKKYIALGLVFLGVSVNLFGTIGGQKVSTQTNQINAKMFIDKQVNELHKKIKNNGNYKSTREYNATRGPVCNMAVKMLKELPLDQQESITQKYKAEAKEHCAAELRKNNITIN